MQGFLPFSRASFMMDLVALGMVVVVPALLFSIYQVKVKRNYQLHRRIQLALGWTLLIVVALFELDVRLNGWRPQAESSPFYPYPLLGVLWVHLFFAISTSCLWIFVFYGAVRNFSKPPLPNAYSPKHRRTAKIAASFMLCTAVTGWTFFWMAFVA